MNRPPEKKDAKAIFSAAIEYYEPDQWEAYIVNACGEDESLRQRVRELLDAHRQSDSLFDRQAEKTDGLAITERPGSQIGPYTVNPECNVILREFSSGKCEWRVEESMLAALPVCGS